MRYFMQLSYHGADFHGWQAQPNAISVQGELDKAISVLLGQEIHVLGCGRTDAGVHASYFVAQFDTNIIFDISHIIFKLNRMMHIRLAVQAIWQVSHDSNVRFDALSRTYKYYISVEKDPFRSDLSFYYTFPLDIALMNKAAEIMFEFIDFTSFSKVHTDVKTNNCTIMHAKWEQSGAELVFTIKANRFLRNMVRAIVGTLLEVGRGRMSLDKFRSVIESQNRAFAGTSAPAHGLFLINVEYPKELLP